jgi:hypothetical protein
MLVKEFVTCHHMDRLINLHIETVWNSNEYKRPMVDRSAQMFEETRIFKRFKVKEAAFAAFIRSNELINMGQIQNISISGLCLRYLSTDEDNQGCSKIKIFGSNDRFIHLDGVQCRIVFDHEVPEGSWEQISTRRCGVELKKLSVKHLSMLQDFIDHFAFDESQSGDPAG